MRESCLLHQTEAFNDMDKHHTGVLQPATNLILLGSDHFLARYRMW